MQTITALIPAKNEQKNIERCIESVKWCDKIVVLSAGTDETAQIARKMGADVIEVGKQKDDDFVSVQKNINTAIGNTTTSWILRIDADEVVTPELKNEIQEILNNPEDFVAYGVPRKQYFFGDFLKGGDWAYDRLVRLFKPKYARYDPIVPVHEQFKVNGKTGELKNALEHYSHPNLETAVKKFNSYTSIEIESLKDTQTQAILKLLFLPPYIFLRWMIYHHGYRDGLRGVIAGLMRAWYDFLLYAKYLEALRTKNK